MSEETPIVQLHTAKQADSDPTIPIVPVEASLAPHEIERICKAFIRLITTGEGYHDHQEQTNTNHPTTNQRKSSRVHSTGSSKPNH